MKPADPDRILVDLASRLRARTPEGELSHVAVEAIDVVQHALVFTGDPDGLDAWRAALWDGAVTPTTTRSVRAMVTHMNGAIARGEEHAVGEVCNCLEVLFAPPTPTT